MNNFEDESTMKKMAIKMFQSEWNSQTTIKELNDRWYGKFIIKRYLTKRMGFQGREYEVWREYVDQLITLPEGSEKALFNLF